MIFENRVEIFRNSDRTCFFKNIKKPSELGYRGAAGEVVRVILFYAKIDAATGRRVVGATAGRCYGRKRRRNIIFLSSLLSEFSVE